MKDLTIGLKRIFHGRPWEKICQSHDYGRLKASQLYMLTNMALVLY